MQRAVWQATFDLESDDNGHQVWQQGGQQGLPDIALLSVPSLHVSCYRGMHTTDML
jgi:hypothetical protein